MSFLSFNGAKYHNFRRMVVYIQSELDSLKQEKREIKQNLKFVDECLREKLYTVCIDIADMEERISNTVEMPEYSYGKDERVWDDSSKDAVSYNSPEELYEEKPYEEKLYDMEVRASSTDFYEDAGKEGNSVLSVAKSDINDVVKGMRKDIYGEPVSDAVIKEPVADVSEMEEELVIVITKESVTDKIGNALTENVATDSNITQNKLTYEAYCMMTPEEKAKVAGFVGMRSFDTVLNVVQAMFYEMGHKAGIDEIMAEAKVLYEGMEKYVIRLHVDEIIRNMENMEVPYNYLSVREKAVLFHFQVEDSEYNLKLYSAVMKALGIRQSMDEMYEDYQGIYDKTVEMRFSRVEQKELETDFKLKAR